MNNPPCIYCGRGEQVDDPAIKGACRPCLDRFYKDDPWPDGWRPEPTSRARKGG